MFHKGPVHRPHIFASTWRRYRQKSIGNRWGFFRLLFGSNGRRTNTALTILFALSLSALSYGIYDQNERLTHDRNREEVVKKIDLYTLNNDARASYDMLLSIWRIRAVVAEFKGRTKTLKDLSSVRKQVTGHLMSFEPNTPLGANVRMQPSFPAAYADVQLLLHDLERFEKSKIPLAVVFESIERATDSWALFKQDLYNEEDATRGDFQQNALAWNVSERRAIIAQLMLSVLMCGMLIAMAWAVFRLRSIQRIRRQELKHVMATVSHDLRNPLQAMQSISSILRDKQYSEKTIELGTILGSLCQAMNQLIDDVFRSSLGKKLAETRDTVDIRRWFEDVAGVYRILANGKSFEFTADLKADFSMVVVDQYRLRQCIGNILDNAFKFTHSGNVSFSVRGRSTTLNRGILEFTATDSGVGIPGAERESIFRPFSRGSFAGETAGLGLGLSIVNNLVSQWGGTIECKSVVGVGTTFIVTVPVQIPRIENDELESADTSQKTDERALCKERILLVDDDHLVLDVGSRLLDEIGYQHDTASDAMAALRMLEENTYDVAILDINMPGMSGIELAEKIRASAGSQPYLIALSANIMDANKWLHKELFDQVLSKPIDLNKLLGALDPEPEH